MGIPYYRKTVLRFECQRCGDCCSSWQGAVYITLEDVPGMASVVGLTPGQFIVEYTKRDMLGHRHLVLRENGDCIFYEEGRCIVNETKPASCWAWPFWRKVCTTKRGWERAAKYCPGIGSGRAWAPDEIEKRIEHSP